MVWSHGLVTWFGTYKQTSHTTDQSAIWSSGDVSGGRAPIVSDEGTYPECFAHVYKVLLEVGEGQSPAEATPLADTDRLV